MFLLTGGKQCRCHLEPQFRDLLEGPINLQYIEQAYKQTKKQAGADNVPDVHEVHLVTQIVNSMLGLIVFPREEALDEKKRQKNKPSNLETAMKQEACTSFAPQFKTAPDYAEPQNLHELVEQLRHAASHRHVYFEKNSDSPDPSDVIIRFENYDLKEEKCIWKATIPCNELHAFCVQLACF